MQVVRESFGRKKGEVLYECFLQLRVNNQYVLPTVIETIDLNTTTLWCGFGLLDIMAIYW